MNLWLFWKISLLKLKTVLFTLVGTGLYAVSSPAALSKPTILQPWVWRVRIPIEHIINCAMHFLHLFLQLKWWNSILSLNWKSGSNVLIKIKFSFRCNKFWYSTLMNKNRSKCIWFLQYTGQNNVTFWLLASKGYFQPPFYSTHHSQQSRE